MSDLDVSVQIGRVLTQYRESPNFLDVLRFSLDQVKHVADLIDGIPEFFDINTAVGDQLTIIGKRLGWPRDHQICETKSIYGTPCEGDSDEQFVGPCEELANWEDCITNNFVTVRLSDDELYRRFLRVRVYQLLNLYFIDDMNECCRILWGDKAMIVGDDPLAFIAAPGRLLTTSERAVVQLYPRVFPTPYGVRMLMHFGVRMPLLGAGLGWGGPCDAQEESGVLADFDGALISDSDGRIFAIEGGSDWICPIDVHPYDCP